MIAARGLAIEHRLLPTDLDLEPGRLVALVGPNGGGKTSLLRALAGVERASGAIVINQTDIRHAHPAQRRQLLGLLPASRDLHWPIAVRDVIGLGLDFPDEEHVESLITRLELEALADRPSDQLSTGERARVLMARVLASRPSLLLLDEPLSNLDPYWVLRFLDILDEEAGRGAAVVVALHDLAQLARFDRALLIAGGRVVNDETPGALLASPGFEAIFRIVRVGGAFAISPTAGPRSSP